MIPFRATRLAPSPTGALHLGHARTFLITWCMARQAGAKIYMRMEDLDAGRAKAESVQQAYDDLRWLGMEWDAFEEVQNSESSIQSEVVQSQRVGLYEHALEKLWQIGAVYPCVCSRAEILASVQAGAGAPHEGEVQLHYAGTCRGKFAGNSMPEALGKAVAAHGRACLRLKVRPGVVQFEDAIAGPQGMDVAREAGDFPLTRFVVFVGKTIGGYALPAAYQLACVVDDHAMGIDMVIRGDDLLPSTPRQMLVYEALGFEPPRFAHVPLVIGPDGKRLAKRHGESRIAQFRDARVSAEKIVGWVAWRSGQLEEPQELSARDLAARFDLARLPKERIVLSDEDLAFLRP